MDHNLSPLERAFQLAKSGTCTSVEDIRKGLKSEGYSVNQIDGRTLLKQLTALIKESKPQSDL